MYVKDGKLVIKDDTIGFGSTAPYYIEAGKKYNVRLLIKNGIFEIYVNERYMQTFNTTHLVGVKGELIHGIGCISSRRKCKLSDIKIYKMNI